jgi:hypothetical protein
MRAVALLAFVIAAAGLAACRPDYPPNSTRDPHYAAPAAPDIHYAPPAIQDPHYALPEAPPTAPGTPQSLRPPVGTQPMR